MISVCLASYNGAAYIRQQLESIIPQLSEGDEIIISDDGSTDGTLDVVAAMESPLIKVVVNQGDHGYTPNFENALRHASGDYIFLSDQDDVWRADKVDVCLRHLRDVDMVIADASLIDGEGKEIGGSYHAIRGSRPGLLANLVRFSYLGCFMAFRRRVLDRALPFPANHRYCTHDNWLGIVAMTFYTVRVIDDKLIGYRRHGANTSAGGLKKTTSAWFKIAYRLYLLRHLAARIRT